MARRLSPADRLSMLVLVGFLALTISRDPHPMLTASLILAVAAFLAGLAIWAGRSPVGQTAHAFFAPYAAVSLLFELSARVVGAIHAPSWDGRLAAADARYFPHLASGWRDLLGRPPWLTDLAAVAYVSFYALPFLVGVAIFLRRTRRDFQRFAFTIEAAFFLPYAGYIAMPASGPRDAVSLQGAHVAQTLHAFIGGVELNGFDAFPSGHTVVSLVVAWLGARAFPKWSAALALTAGAIIFSTVYLAYHYVVDVVAGALLAASMPLALPVLRTLSGVRSRREVVAARIQGRALINGSHAP